MAQSKGSNVLIQQLLKAEEEADLVIKKAKDGKIIFFYKMILFSPF